MADVAVDIRASCKLPLVLDAGGGWGDPVHVHRTVALAEAAGFAAIEIEDQLLPRRVEHHVGIDHLVPTEFFVQKLKEALAARTDPNLVIIARTNARAPAASTKRSAAARPSPRPAPTWCSASRASPEEVRMVGERVPPR